MCNYSCDKSTTVLVFQVFSLWQDSGFIFFLDKPQSLPYNAGMDKNKSNTLNEAAKQSGLEVSEIKLIDAYCEVTGNEVEYTPEMLDEAQGSLVLEFWNENIDDPSIDELARDFVENDGFGEAVPEIVKDFIDYKALGEWLAITYNINGRYIFA